MATFLATNTALSAGMASALTFGGAAIAIIAAVSMIMGSVNSAVSEAESKVPKKKMALGGGVLPRAGGTDVTVGEAGQAEAIVPLNRAENMGFGGEIDYDKMAAAMSKANINVNTNIRHDAFEDYNTIGGDGEYQSETRYASNFV